MMAGRHGGGDYRNVKNEDDSYTDEGRKQKRHSGSPSFSLVHLRQTDDRQYQAPNARDKPSSARHQSKNPGAVRITDHPISGFVVLGRSFEEREAGVRDSRGQKS